MGYAAESWGRHNRIGEDMKIFKSETAALNFLKKRGFKNKRFVLYHPNANYRETLDEESALYYLANKHGWKIAMGNWITIKQIKRI